MQTLVFLGKNQKDEKKYRPQFGTKLGTSITEDFAFASITLVDNANPAPKFCIVGQMSKIDVPGKILSLLSLAPSELDSELKGGHVWLAIDARKISKFPIMRPQMLKDLISKLAEFQQKLTDQMATASDANVTELSLEEKIQSMKNKPSLTYDSLKIGKITIQKVRSLLATLQQPNSGDDNIKSRIDQYILSNDCQDCFSKKLMKDMDTSSCKTFCTANGFDKNLMAEFLKDTSNENVEHSLKGTSAGIFLEYVTNVYDMLLVYKELCSFILNESRSSVFSMFVEDADHIVQLMLEMPAAD